MTFMRILSTIAVVCLIPAQAYADKILFFSPSRVILNDAAKVEVLNITNLSSAARAYTVSTEDLIMTPEGVTSPVENFDYSAKRMIRFVPRKFVLQPGERQAVRVMGRIKGDVGDGDYHTHLKFLEDASQRSTLNPSKDKQQATISAPLAYETMIPVIFSHGKTEAKLSIDKSAISSQVDKVKIDLKIGRSGNGQGIGFVHTHYIDAKGSAEILTPRRTVNVYRELDQRNFSYDFKLAKKLDPAGKIRVYLHDTDDKDSKPIGFVELDIP